MISFLIDIINPNFEFVRQSL